jgi:GT2 family glycosyltransferase/glycosyltransferase involved in cell wall biosynthesis
MQKLFPDLPLVVVAEFPVAGVRWIPYPAGRSFLENYSLFRWHFRGQSVRLCAVVLQPQVPYRRMRWMAFLLAPRNFLAFNENFGHFMLRPRSLPTIVRHLLWRTRNLLVSRISAARALDVETCRRHLHALRAILAGAVITVLKTVLPRRRSLEPASQPKPSGISVVIPSRNGKDLLAVMLPETVRQIGRFGGEVIVIDNGSSDGTAEFVTETYPTVVLEANPRALSFARAINAGIRKARFSHVCLLNNDMAIGPSFFEALSAAFSQVPELFCATAQIFFPGSARREETGKAVMPSASDQKPTDFPLRCDLPFPGEDMSYVLYGSGGCSLLGATQLVLLQGMDESYDPAYVEDLDLGFRAWQQGWPSVFVAGAHAIHQHRATLSRYHSQSFLDQKIELHYLRFLASAVADPMIFWRKWLESIRRLNTLSAASHPPAAARAALEEAWCAPLWFRRSRRPLLSERHVLAIGSGAVAVFPGRSRRPGRRLVLVATPYLPFPLSHGGAVRMFNLMRRAAPDYDQVLVAFTTELGEVPEELLKLCCEVVLVKRQGSHVSSRTRRPQIVEEYDSPAYRAALLQSVHKWQPAVVQLEYTQMAQYAAHCRPAKTVLVEHDITFDLYRQLLKQSDDWEVRHQLERWIRFERSAWNQVDRVVTMSAKDRAMALAAGVSPDRAVCLPNGVDVDRFRPAASEMAEARRLLFIGSFAHLPNLLAIEFFLNEAWPALRAAGATLHIIAGENCEYHLARFENSIRLDLAQPGIELEGFVADVRPAYNRAAIVVAPLMASAGTNIKVIEAMAMGKAVVSTPSGVDGLDLEHGKDVIVASTGPAIAKAILELFENQAMRRFVEHEARRTAETRFDIGMR